MSMNVRKCWQGNPCPSGQTCHSNGADITGQGICVSGTPHSIPTHLTSSYDCNKGNCTRRYDSNGSYPTKAACDSQCKRASLTTSYDCNNGNCTIRYDSNGRYPTKASCDSQCAKGSLSMAWKCPEDHKTGARCSKVPGFVNGSTLFADEETCERTTTCGAVPVNLLTEPDWEVGVGEGNPLQIIYSANVGNINDTVVNYM
jgi:hypothetical protein